MSRLRFPTGPEARAKAARGSGSPVRLDAISTASLTADGVLTVALDADGVLVTAAHATQPLPHWTIEASAAKPATAGEPITLPEAIVARLNRLMLADGPSVRRNWRSKAHDLRAAERRVLPILADEAVTAVLTADGWRALAVAGISAAEARSMAPAGPAPAPAPSPQTAPMPAPVPQPAPASAPEAAPAPAVVAEAGPAPALKPDRSKADQMILSREFVALWDGVRAANKAGDRLVLALTGPAGSGKTEAAEALAAAEGVEFVKFSAVGIMEPADWFGTVVLDGNGTRFVPSDLLTAITKPGARILLVDELNRALLRSLNAMLPLMDRSATFVVPQTGRIERRNPNVQIVVTANIGSAHLGTEPLDEALRDRLVWAELPHLGATDEARLLLQRTEGLSTYHAERLADLAAKVRDNATNGQHPPVSTRQVLAAAALIARGVKPREAVGAAILNGYLSEGGSNSERAKVLPLVEGIAWDEPKPTPATAGARIPDDVFSAKPGAACTCGHGPEHHGLSADGLSPVRIGEGTYCDQDDPCMAYSPRMVAGQAVTR